MYGFIIKIWFYKRIAKNQFCLHRIQMRMARIVTTSQNLILTRCKNDLNIYIALKNIFPVYEMFYILLTVVINNIFNSISNLCKICWFKKSMNVWLTVGFVGVVAWNFILKLWKSYVFISYTTMKGGIVLTKLYAKLHRFSWSFIVVGARNIL